MHKKDVYREQEVRYEGVLYKVVTYNWAESDYVLLENLATGGRTTALCSYLIPNEPPQKTEVDVELFKDIYKILIKEFWIGEEYGRDPERVARVASDYYKAGCHALKQLEKYYN